MVLKQVFLLFFTLVVGALPTHALEPSKALEQAINLHSKGDWNASYLFLQKINPESLEYKYAFIEMQKIHYRQKQWDKFFGYATFYRKKLLTQFFDPNLLLLETLALIKHCQFKTVFSLIAFGKTLAQTLKSESKNNPTLKALWNTELRRHHNSQSALNQELTLFQTQLQAIQDLLTLQKELAQQIQTTAVENIPSAFSNQIEWPINLKQSTDVIQYAVKNPNAIRVFVKNECGKQS